MQGPTWPSLPWLFLAPSGALHAEARSPTGPRAPSNRQDPADLGGGAVIQFSFGAINNANDVMGAHLESILRHRPSFLITTLGLGNRHLGWAPFNHVPGRPRQPHFLILSVTFLSAYNVYYATLLFPFFSFPVFSAVSSWLAGKEKKKKQWRRVFSRAELGVVDSSRFFPVLYLTSVMMAWA